ncbi:MAG: hypothetical protein K6U74_02435 [Firmicutes bacterium]|nr:hypothetical protein [Bacillota bacterium]
MVVDGKKVTVETVEAKSVEQALEILGKLWGRYGKCGLVPIVEPDLTAGLIRTPGGVGKFVEFKNGKVTVEMDYMYLVEFDAAECYLY